MRIDLSALSGHLRDADLGGAKFGPSAVASVTGVSTDSRAVTPGQLFVPLVADRDGHEFIAAAVANGADAILTSNGNGLALSAANPAIVVIEVSDTGAGLTEIGRFARSRLTGPVVGITGSVGKTSVKDLTRAACAAARPTWASERSFNNEIGVPLTLANAPDNTEITIVEMGSRGQGHIAELCQLAAPTVGVVTEVAMAHSEMFGSIETIAESKGELIASLPDDGWAVLNADNPLVAAMADRSSARILTFGFSPDAAVKVEDVALNECLQPSFTLVHAGQGHPVTLSVAGRHMALNAAAAVAAAIAAGVDVETAVTGVSTATLSPMRMEVLTLSSGAVVINDAYNANPTSMQAAFEALMALPSERRVAVVGLMAELGEGGDEEHRRLAENMVDAGVRVVAVDARAYGDRAEHVDAAEAAAELLASIGAGDAVLVKGSRVAGLERLVSALDR